MAEIGVHVAAADADGCNANCFVLGSGHGIGHVSKLDRFGAGIDERLHGPTQASGSHGTTCNCSLLAIGTQVEIDAGKVLGQPDVGSTGMPFHALET